MNDQPSRIYRDIVSVGSHFSLLLILQVLVVSSSSVAIKFKSIHTFNILFTLVIMKSALKDIRHIKTYE